MSDCVHIRNSGAKVTVGGFPLEPGDHVLTPTEAAMMQARDPEKFAALVAAAAPVKVEPAEETPSVADLNADGVVDGEDLSIIMTEYNKQKPAKKAAKKKASKK